MLCSRGRSAWGAIAMDAIVPYAYCASVEEVRAILDLYVDPGQILFVNPCKSPVSDIFARNAGIFRTVFDNIDELDTTKDICPMVRDDSSKELFQWAYEMCVRDWSTESECLLQGHW